MIVELSPTSIFHCLISSNCNFSHHLYNCESTNAPYHDALPALAFYLVSMLSNIKYCYVITQLFHFNTVMLKAKHINAIHYSNANTEYRNPKESSNKEQLILSDNDP